MNVPPSKNSQFIFAPESIGATFDTNNVYVDGSIIELTTFQALSSANVFDIYANQPPYFNLATFNNSYTAIQYSPISNVSAIPNLRIEKTNIYNCNMGLNVNLQPSLFLNVYLNNLNIINSVTGLYFWFACSYIDYPYDPFNCATVNATILQSNFTSISDQAISLTGTMNSLVTIDSINVTSVEKLSYLKTFSFFLFSFKVWFFMYPNFQCHIVAPINEFLHFRITKWQCIIEKKKYLCLIHFIKKTACYSNQLKLRFKY